MTLLISRSAASRAILGIALTASCAARAGSTVDAILGDKLEATVGVGVDVAPRYMGSDTYRTTAIPVLSLQRGIFYADTSSGIGVQYQSASGFYLAQSIYYDAGRREKKGAFVPGSSRLLGMGEVPGSATWHSIVGQQLSESVSVSAEADVTLKSGLHRRNLRAGVEWVPYKTSADQLVLDLNTHWGNAEYNQAYFGVTADQAARTNFRQYTSGSGMYAYSMTARWEHQLASHWTGSVQLTAMPFVSKAKSSPLMERDHGLDAVVSVRYTY